MKLRTGDTVQVMSGRSKGKSGKILKVDFKNCTVRVEGIMGKKRSSSSAKKAGGQVVDAPIPLPFSKVLVFCVSCGRGRRMGFKKGSSTRCCRGCGEAC